MKGWFLRNQNNKAPIKGLVFTTLTHPESKELSQM